MVLSVFVGILYLYLYGNQSFLFLLVRPSFPLIKSNIIVLLVLFVSLYVFSYFSYSLLFSFYLFLSFIEFKMMLFVFAVRLSFYLYLNYSFLLPIACCICCTCCTCCICCIGCTCCTRVGELENQHKVGEALGEEPWQERGQDGTSPSPETWRPHRQGQCDNALSQ